MQNPSPRGTLGRIETVDIARGLALLAMASFHFAWDLEFFGYLHAGYTAQGFPRLYARGIASTFLLLVGVGLVLAHGDGIRWRGFRRRFAMVAGAAGLITLGTYSAMPDEFIFFGILHGIAFASLAGLAFLRLPPPLTVAAAALAVAAPHFLRSPLFDHPALWWTGLSAANPRSNDFVPVLPWFGVVLVGMAAAQAAKSAGLVERLAPLEPPRMLRPLGFLGRHSLAFYLLHQPLLIGLLWLFALAVPPVAQTAEERFAGQCDASCMALRDGDFCARYCPCMLDNVAAAGMMQSVAGGRADEQTKARIQGFAGLCAGIADDALRTEP